MGKLASALRPGMPVHYIRGEEDRKNLEELEELQIPKRLANPKTRKELLERSAQDLKELLDKMRTQREELEKQQEELKKQREGLKRRSEEYIKLSEDITNARQEEQRVGRQIREREVEIARVQHEIQVSAPLSKMFNRKSISPDLSEILFRLAKKEYYAKHHEIFSDLDVKLETHSSNEVMLDLDGILFNLKHSTNDKSDSPSSNAIKDMLRENQQRRRLDQVIPDVTITAHGQYGCRMQWQPKTEEPIGEGERRPTPEQTTNIQLPAFQSPILLSELKEKLPRNLHVRRYSEGLFGSGAVIHRFYDNEVQEVEMISVPELIKYGAIAEQLRDLQKQLRSKKSGKEHDELKAKIAKLEDIVRVPPSSLAKPKEGKALLIEGYSDVHLGSQTYPGRPTPGDMAVRAINYQRRDERLPDILFFGGDILHGILKHTSANAQWAAKTPAELSLEEKKLAARSDLSDLQKAQAIADLYRDAHTQMNITNMAKQREEFVYTFKPYCAEVLKNGGKVVIVSGNHFNKTTKSSGGEAIDDEAYALAQLLDGYEKYKAEGKIVLMHGLGEEYGIGTTPIGCGKTLYAVHEPGRGSDPALGLMRKVKSEDRAPHLAFAGHLHIPTIGFADGMFAVEFPGMQSWSQYLTLFNANASLRGKMNVEVDTKKQWSRMRGVFDPTLERPEYR
jgi:hypothetical protein